MMSSLATEKDFHESRTTMKNQSFWALLRLPEVIATFKTLLSTRKDAQDIRGNLQTRIAKMENGNL